MKKPILILASIAVLTMLVGVSIFLYSQYLQSKELELSRQKAVADCIEKEIGPSAGTGYAASLKNSRAKSKCEGYFRE